MYIIEGPPNDGKNNQKFVKFGSNGTIESIVTDLQYRYLFSVCFRRTNGKFILPNTIPISVWKILDLPQVCILTRE